MKSTQSCLVLSCNYYTLRGRYAYDISAVTSVWLCWEPPWSHLFASGERLDLRALQVRVDNVKVRPMQLWGLHIGESSTTVSGPASGSL